VKFEYFFRPVTVRLVDVEHRRHSSFPEKHTAAIEHGAVEELERYLAAGGRCPARFVVDASVWNDLDIGELVTEVFRLPLGLAVPDVILEEFQSVDSRSLRALGAAC
jgi:hypothetical protein